MISSPIVRELLNTEKAYRSTNPSKETLFTPYKHGFDLLESENQEVVLSGYSIRKICMNYRLRCLDISYFKGDIPPIAWEKVGHFEKSYHVRFTDFKIIAPDSLFKLESRDKDPILLGALPNGKFVYIHKWGRELSPIRKVWAWTMRSLETQLFFCFVAALTFVSIYAYSGSELYGEFVNYQSVMLAWIATSLTFSLLWLFICFAFKIHPTNMIWKSRFLD